jgi:transposase-like protein
MKFPPVNHSIRHFKKYRNLNGRIIQDTDITEENNNGHIKIKIKQLAKPKCVTFRRNHLLFTNKHRGYFKNNGTLRKKLDRRARQFYGTRKSIHKKRL